MQRGGEGDWGEGGVCWKEKRIRFSKPLGQESGKIVRNDVAGLLRDSFERGTATEESISIQSLRRPDLRSITRGQGEGQAPIHTVRRSRAVTGERLSEHDDFGTLVQSSAGS